MSISYGFPNLPGLIVLKSAAQQTPLVHRETLVTSLLIPQIINLDEPKKN